MLHDIATPTPEWGCDWLHVAEPDYKCVREANRVSSFAFKMSGFQEVAAAIGVAEVALRSILKVYEFLCDLHDAPATIVRLSNELSELTGCFTALSSRPLDRTAREALADLNLSQIISRCGTTCTKLQADLSHWAKSGQEHLYTRLRFRLNRSRIQGVTEQITVAKQTLTLAVTISIRCVPRCSDL